MGSVTALPGTSAQWKEEVTEMLREWLARAENGELKGIAIVGIHAGDDDGEERCLSQYHTGNKPFLLVGAVEAIKHDILHGHINGRSY